MKCTAWTSQNPHSPRTRGGYFDLACQQIWQATPLYAMGCYKRALRAAWLAGLFLRNGGGLVLRIHHQREQHVVGPLPGPCRRKTCFAITPSYLEDLG